MLYTHIAVVNFIIILILYFLRTTVFIYNTRLKISNARHHTSSTHRETSTSWIISLPKHCARAKYTRQKPLEYVRNCTSVRTEGIKVLSRDRQLGRRDIRSLAAAAIPLFPSLSDSFFLPFSPSLSFPRQRNFLPICT